MTVEVNNYLGDQFRITLAILLIILAQYSYEGQRQHSVKLQSLRDLVGLTKDFTISSGENIKERVSSKFKSVLRLALVSLLNDNA